jgi:hypothetical protein
MPRVSHHIEPQDPRQIARLQSILSRSFLTEVCEVQRGAGHARHPDEYVTHNCGACRQGWSGPHPQGYLEPDGTWHRLLITDS